MKSLLLLTLLASIPLFAAEEFAPWLPERRSVQKIQTLPPPVSRNTEVRSLDGLWKFSGLSTSDTPFREPDSPAANSDPGLDDSNWDSIKVPDSWFLKYPKQEKIPGRPYFKGWYRREFQLAPKDLEGKRVLLSFDAVAYDAKVFLNGKEIGTHRGDFTPFELDGTEAAKAGRNVLAVRVLTDRGRAGGIPLLDHAYGSNWIMKGGIWQSVRLLLVPRIRVASILVTPFREQKRIEADYRIVNHTGKTEKIRLTARVTSAIAADKGKEIGSRSREVILKPGWNTGTLEIALNAPQEWSPENPYLYHLTLDTGSSSRSVRFGFRDFRARNGKFYLNGKEIYLFGQNISSVVYGGRGKDPELERRQWEKTVRNFLETGSRIIRTAHGPVPFWLLDIADEYGLMFYMEWGWCISTNLDQAAFVRNNNAQLTEFIERCYNNPCVVMWCGGNEIRHQKRPDIVKLLCDQVRLIRSLDKSKRPVSVFSGAGGWYNYGENRLDTDVLDMHNYTSLYDPWTTMMDLFHRQLAGILRIYGDKEKSSRPQIAWENVGYSWGAWTPDLKFRRGNVEQYAEYMSRKTSWAEPNGVGFVGTSPLFKAVGPGFGSWAQLRYGHRIFEYFRLNPGFAGFAPWFPANDSSLLWNQEVYPSFLNQEELFPHHFFLDRPGEWKSTVVNDGSRSYSSIQLEWHLLNRKKEIIPLGRKTLKTLPAHGRVTGTVRLEFPSSLPAGDYQLRLAVRNGKELIGRNYYNIHLQASSLLTEKIPSAKRIFILNTGAEKNVRKLQAILKDHKLDAGTVSSAAEAGNGSVLIIPPEFAQPQQLDMDRDSALERFLLQRGGTLLVLEQKNLKTVFPGNHILLPHSTTFVDMVSPSHPVFSGLDYWHFDTWMNPDHGFVISHSLVPFTMNAVMVKGPTISRTNFGSALVEATLGKGRMILSQLDAVANRERDCVAAKYLRNLLAYAVGGNYWKEARPLASIQRNFELKKERVCLIDLSSSVTTGFRDETDNDGKGGWTDQGGNDFRRMPLGLQSASGVPFRILDPARNNGRSCIVLRGTNRPEFPNAVRNIRIGKRLSRLFFLHTAGWGQSGLAGAYRIHYADGTSVDIPLQGGVNIGDWWQCDTLPNAKVGLTVTLPEGRTIGTYIASWDNPSVEKEIVSFDFLSENARKGNEIDWMPDKTPVPILIAVTGETVSPDCASLLSDGIFLTAANAREHGSKLEGRVKTGKNGNRRQLDVEFPACSGNDVPAIRIAFRPEKVASGYSYLAFWIRSNTSAVVETSLPCGKWEGSYNGELTLIGDGKWHKYRLRFNEDFRLWKKCSQKNLRGELFLFSHSTRAPGAERSSMRFSIREITLE